MYKNITDQDVTICGHTKVIVHPGEIYYPAAGMENQVYYHVSMGHLAAAASKKEKITAAQVEVAKVAEEDVVVEVVDNSLEVVDNSLEVEEDEIDDLPSESTLSTPKNKLRRQKRS